MNKKIQYLVRYEVRFHRSLTLTGVNVWAYPTLADTTSKFKSLSSVVIFGDSYTDQGLAQYRPGSNGEVGTPV